MKQKSETGLKVGDRVRLIAQTIAWRAEMTLQGQIGEVIERHDDGRITIRFYNGRLPEWIKSAWRPGLHQWGR